MELIKWSEDYSVGITEIDNQHKGLIIIINELFDLVSKGKSKDSLDLIFEHLASYTEIHFKAEELMMSKFNYSEINQHKLEHDKFIKALNIQKLNFNQGKITISLEVLNFLKDWLLNHILISDKKYSSYIIEK